MPNPEVFYAAFAPFVVKFFLRSFFTVSASGGRRAA
jgi:hypothetical protein